MNYPIRMLLTPVIANMTWTNPFAESWRKKNKAKEMEYLEGEMEKLQECERDVV